MAIKFNKKELKIIAEKYSLSDIYFFGSQISGDTHPESDFDIGIIFEKGLPKKERKGKIYGNIFSELTTCFGGKKIDLVFVEEVPLHFQFRIISEGELIYTKNLENSFNFKEKIINHYRDYKFFIDEYFKGVLAISSQS